MKKQLGIFTAMTALTATLYGCGADTAAAAGAEQNTETAQDRLQIVTTIYPEYDWVMNVLGDQAANADVKMLLDNGVDLHSYQPSAQDIVTISDCDVFVYVGGESDNWVKDTLAEVQNTDMVVIDLMEALGDTVKEEEIIEGMEAEEEEEEEGEEEEGPEYDEHVWLSLKNAQALCGTIADGLALADPANADAYHANADAYKAELSALDAEYQGVVDAASNKTLLFADRFPFRYMIEDYDLDYYAAFVGCSSETEASFETVMFLAGKTDELGLKNLLIIEGSDGKLADTVKNATETKDQQILTLNSLQSVSSTAAKDGISYLSVMRDNLEVLKQALQ
ncbi:MAG: zinc ABC transporter substrate-binding protein [Lachnospiraceae bacterium]|nr:zinc ABC transporter substrate-binding protein [Lachnospiraceae bacterium]